MAEETNVEALVEAADLALGDDFEEVEQPEAEAAPTEQPTVQADPWDMEVPDDQLSGYWKNKKLQTGQPVRVRDVLSAADTAEEKIRQQGEMANAERDRARVLQAQLQATTDMLRELRAPKEPPRAPSYQDVGMRDPNSAILEDPARYTEQVADLGARRARAEMDPRIQNVEQALAQLQNQAQLSQVRNAAEEARMALGIPVEQWRPLGEFMYGSAGNHEEGPMSPNAWKAAYQRLSERFPQAPARTSLPQEGIVRGNPAGSSRPTPVNTGVKPKARVRGLISAVDQEAIKHGLDPEIARQIAQRTEEKLQMREAKE